MVEGTVLGILVRVRGLEAEEVTTLGSWLATLLADLTQVTLVTRVGQLALAGADADTDGVLRGLVERVYTLARVAFGCELLIALERA